MSAPSGLRVIWVTGPRQGNSSFKVISAQPFSLKDAWAEMPEMGHGTNPFDIQTMSATEALISNIWFKMRGLWRIFLQTERETVSFDVEVQ